MESVYVDETILSSIERIVEGQREEDGNTVYFLVKTLNGEGLMYIAFKEVKQTKEEWGSVKSD